MVDLFEAKAGDEVVFYNGAEAVIQWIYKYKSHCSIRFDKDDASYKYNKDGSLWCSQDKLLKIVELMSLPEPLPDVVRYCNAYDDDIFGYFCSDKNELETKTDRLAVIKLTFNPNTKEVKAEVVE